ncbi:class I SAM-dependent methyltransferase [Sphingomonas sp.]|uniref:class I SAM-dependent methyltransferase n=1 Tax=Sphingomonas sp. TaxID=28214 RepID=UPI002E316A17|nr:class I SAM-dependent methyltransferase [Sphingomonas sp.]HEX4693393.1 class I SAM-dependent methyltransferase [Sphingomonas sp.]
MNAPPTLPERLDRTLAAYHEARDDLRVRTRLAQLLAQDPNLAELKHRGAIADLVRDLRIDPRQVERAGWHIVLASGAVPDSPEAAASWLEGDELALGLLSETHVTVAAAEAAASAIRRWLLIEGRAADYPRAAAALIAQAALNEGCWPFDADEAAALATAPDFALAYLPPPPPHNVPPAFVAPITRAVAAQYADWPYPTWQRANALPPRHINRRLASLGPGAPQLPRNAQILVAGCGTGSEAYIVASAAPDCHVTAIDLSATSIAYARERCAGLSNITFRQHDLNRVAELGQTFDYISTSGVLHCVPDPEAAWAGLVDVLEPGGGMHVMLYSRLARLAVTAAQRQLGELMERPVDADLIREARARLIADPVVGINDSPDFFSAGGVYDLLLHVHEDLFDVPRIEAAVASMGLDLIHFTLPDAAATAQYRAEFPGDPWRRSFANWAEFEFRHPGMFGPMYGLECVKPA